MPPFKCNVFAGGFLFNDAGNESKQLDVIVTTDTTPRFDLHNADGAGKSFSPVDGTLAAVALPLTRIWRGVLKDQWWLKSESVLTTKTNCLWPAGGPTKERGRSGTEIRGFCLPLAPLREQIQPASSGATE